MDIIDKTQNIYSIVSIHPEIKDIMSNLGFTDILKSGMLQSMGRFMTIEKGARIKGIKMSDIEEVFLANGFKLI
jgi:hypothetical protein